MESQTSTVGINGAGQAQADLSILPRRPILRALVIGIAAASAALTFAAWLSPNMVFDFANLVFCG